MQLIGTDTASGSLSSLAVSSIPATYEHLIVILYGRGSSSSGPATEVQLTFNGDSGANYSYQNFTSINTTVAGASAAGQTSIACGCIPNDGAGSSYAGQILIDVCNYKNTTFYKTACCAQAWTTATASDGNLRNVGSAWASTTAITNVTMVLAAGNFNVGSSLWVYGY